MRIFKGHSIENIQTITIDTIVDCKQPSFNKMQTSKIQRARWIGDKIPTHGFWINGRLRKTFTKRKD